MKWILFTLLFFGSIAEARQLRVVVLDTGIQSKYKSQLPLCNKGHKSFVPGETIEDNHGHGTNIAGLIKKNAGEVDYCLIIVKYYSKYAKKNSIRNIIRALSYVNALKPDIINLSGGGYWSVLKEYLIVQSILHNGIQFIVAAGNENMDLDKNCNYYPACYDKRIWVIGAKDVASSNYGSLIDFFIDGKNKTAFGITMTGTSQSTAIFTGRVIHNLSKE